MSGLAAKGMGGGMGAVGGPQQASGTSGPRATMVSDPGPGKWATLPDERGFGPPELVGGPPLRKGGGKGGAPGGLAGVMGGISGAAPGTGGKSGGGGPRAVMSDDRGFMPPQVNNAGNDRNRYVQINKRMQ